MLVVTAGTAEYRPYIEKQAAFCKQQGYKHTIYDLGGLGIGHQVYVDPSDFAATVGGGLPAARFKPWVVMEAALSDSAVGEHLIAWLDGDCVPVRDIKPSGEWDAAVTLRPDPELGASGLAATDWLNSGVVFIRRSGRGGKFLWDWREACAKSTGDQAALNELVGKGWGRVQWAAARGTVADKGVYRIMILSSPEWNCWQFPAPPEARIFHYKRGLRKSS